jgi:SAM-dependent methyltransferase
MFENPYAYQKFLMQQAFATDAGVVLRKQMHDLYSNPPLDLPKWVLDRIAWTGQEQVLDIGSGPGVYYEEIAQRIAPEGYIGGDLSLGMLKAFHEHLGFAKPKLGLMDIESLPFAAQSFDVILANHVLEYAPNAQKAVMELHRILRRPKGLLVIATSSEYTMPEFHTLMQRAIRLLRRGMGDDGGELSMSYSFTLEQGTSLLSRHFPCVARYDIPNAFIFHDAQPVNDYVESCRPFYEPKLPNNVKWDDFMTIMSDQVRRLVDHFGELVVTKLTGVIIATDAGGFAEDYQKRLHEK